MSSFLTTCVQASLDAFRHPERSEDVLLLLKTSERVIALETMHGEPAVPILSHPAGENQNNRGVKHPQYSNLSHSIQCTRGCLLVQMLAVASLERATGQAQDSCSAISGDQMMGSPLSPGCWAAHQMVQSLQPADCKIAAAMCPSLVRSLVSNPTSRGFDPMTFCDFKYAILMPQ